MTSTHTHTNTMVGFFPNEEEIEKDIVNMSLEAKNKVNEAKSKVYHLLYFEPSIKSYLLNILDEEMERINQKDRLNSKTYKKFVSDFIDQEEGWPEPKKYLRSNYQVEPSNNNHPVNSSTCDYVVDKEGWKTMIN